MPARTAPCYRFAHIALLPAMAVALASGAGARPIATYQQDFEAEAASAGTEWTLHLSGAPNTPLTPPTAHTPGFSRFLGNLLNDTATLHTLLTPGQQYELKFDLYIIDSWDGNDTAWGPDRFRVNVNGVRRFDHTFSNTPSQTQSYPGAPSVQFVNLGFSVYSDAIYRGITIGFTSIGADAFDFYGFGLQTPLDESWGIDNVRITPVPGPGAAGLLVGAGLLGARRRRR